jgi:cobalt-zinc-cadmium efflux system outer membrane protein
MRRRQCARRTRAASRLASSETQACRDPIFENPRVCGAAATACGLLFHGRVRLLISLLVCLVARSSLAQVPQTAATERLTLEAAIAEALARNLDLVAARAGITLAEADLITARLRPNPVLSLGGDHLDVLGTRFNDENGAGPPEYSARVDFLLERGAKRARRIEVAVEERAIAEAEVRDRVRALTVEVQHAFVDLQLAQENLALARENAASFAEIVTLNDARVRGGEVAEVELLRSRIAALQSQQAVRAAELKVQTERRRLERLIGRAPGTVFDIEAVPCPAALTASVPDLRPRVLQARPDLQALRHAQARSRAEIRLQLAQGQIDWTVGAEYRRQEGVAGRGNSLGLFISTPLPLFDRNQGNRARVRAESERADTRARQLEQVIASEVDVAAAQYTAADATLAAIETEMLEQARDVRAITEYAYRRGEATLIELLDAQRAFNETMQAWNEARAEYARSVFLVQASVGEGRIP